MASWGSLIYRVLLLLVLSQCIYAQVFNSISTEYRTAHRWALVKGYETAFRHGHQHAWFAPGYPIAGLVTLDSSIAEVHQVPGSSLTSNPSDLNSHDERSRACYNYALSTVHSGRYLGGFPTYEDARSASGEMEYGVVLLKAPAKRITIKRSELSSWSDNWGRARSFFDWGTSRSMGFVMPDFHQGIENGEQVFGAYVFNEGAQYHPAVPFAALRFLNRVRFATSVTLADQPTILESHFLAIQRLEACSFLTLAEKVSILDAYQSQTNVVEFRIGGNCNGATWMDGAVRVIEYCANIFTNGELERTSLHEMTHVAGHDHPTTKPTNTGTCASPSPPFFNTVPLRSECCMPGGIQTLTRDTPATRSCYGEDTGEDPEDTPVSSWHLFTKSRLAEWGYKVTQDAGSQSKHHDEL